MAVQTLEEYPGDGVQTDFNIPFEYLSSSYVRVFINDVETSAWSFLTTSIVRMDVAPAVGETVKVQRITQRDTRIVDFVDGSVLTETDLNTSAIQVLHVVQEAYDNRGAEARDAIADDKAQVEVLAAQIASDRTTVESLYDTFDDRYLGPLATDPTADNDGNPLLVGALYWNTSISMLRFWDGAAWQAIPTGDFLQLSGGTMAGNIRVDADNARNLGADLARFQNIFSYNGDFKGNVLLGDDAADSISFLGTANTPLDMGGNGIDNTADPVEDQDVATKRYVDDTVFVPQVALVQGQALVLSNAVWTVMPLASVSFDPGSIVDLVNNRITPTIAGVYRVSAFFKSQSNLGDGRRMYIAVHKNGLMEFRSLGKTSSSGSDDENVLITGLVQVNGTSDYLEILGYHQAGTNASFVVDAIGIERVY